MAAVQDLTDTADSEACQRCARAGRTCVFTPLQKRRQRKRTDTRVSELERDMRAMRAALQAKEKEAKSAGQNNATRNVGLSPRPFGLWFEENSLQAPVRAGEYGQSSVAQASSGVQPQGNLSRQHGGPTLWPSRFANQPSETKDVVQTGLISMATARQLFESYRTDLCPIYPIVVIPESTTADELRKTKPALFLAIIAAAAGKENSELSAVLDKEVLHMYAERHVVQCEKSLELVQALLISAVWYHPPTRFGQLKYYEYIHMAATMALDIGIGTRPVPHRNLFGNKPSRQGRVHHLEDASNPDLSMTPRSRGTSPDTASLESRRTYLACYLVCGSVSMSLRRPNMLRVSSYIRDCLDYLERSSDSVPSDRTLAAWVRLNIIAEEICTSFSYDDPGDIASITELRTQMMLKDFEKRLTDWYSTTPDSCLSPPVTMMFYSIRIYLHEVALHVDHSPEDFKAPYQMGPVHQWDRRDDASSIPTKVLATAVADCVSSAHSLMNTFTSMPPEQGRALPVFIYVRISFAAFILAKLCLSTAHPGSQIGRVIDKSSLKVDAVMNKAIVQVKSIVGSAQRRVPAIFLALLLKLRQWCLNPQMLEGQQDGTGRPAIDIAHGTQSAPMNTDKSRAQSSTAAFRVTEHVSSEETSPEDDPEVYDNISAYVAKTTAALDHGEENGLTPDEGAQMSNFDSYQPVPYPYPNNQMQLDNDFLQMWGDMNALSQGGLTGLEDWSTMPLDMMGMPESFDWQMSAAGDGNAPT
ncbi:uncharacterized protein LTR77_007756 [Saxophila tyrrhenica]|uniref:Xylanolytic transcriptional activator regulatory domain-containing protein n=1 Tax=Saxophila tyrrhenica TaxID=1690608 RepID=A0AAV9P2W1_9PEZI|nr:hypothetical protein LTR77_007756 [Saxophila tyrrhenica]